MCFHPGVSIPLVLAELLGVALVLNFMGFADRVAGWHTLLGAHPRTARIYGLVFCVGVLTINGGASFRC